jgi:hypothetical protein
MWVFIIGCMVGNIATVLSYKITTYVHENYSSTIGKYAYLAIKKYVEIQQIPCIKYISEKCHIPSSVCKTLASEPIEDEWIATYWITETNHLQYNYIQYNGASRLLSDTDRLLEPSGLNKLYVYKKNDNYQMSLSDTFDLRIPLCPVFYKFISVEYSHPLLDESLLLTIPSSEMVLDSQICSPEHILLLLQKQQHNNYVFDKYYTVYIIDNHLTLHTLAYDSALKLTDTGAVKINIELLSQ